MTKGAIYQRELAAKRRALGIGPSRNEPLPVEVATLRELSSEINEVFKVLRAVEALVDSDAMLKLGMERAMEHLSNAAANLALFLGGEKAYENGDE